MPSSPSPRKPIDALRARDVELYPVWEFIDQVTLLKTKMRPGCGPSKRTTSPQVGMPCPWPRRLRAEKAARSWG